MREKSKNSNLPSIPNEYRSFDLELLWKCTICGYFVHRKEGIPTECPSCGANKTAFILHKED